MPQFAKLLAIAIALLLLMSVMSMAKKHSVSIDTRKSGLSQQFVANNDWQEVRAGQQIPPGLHVRMNLQTGKTEAKLVDVKEAAGSESQKNLPTLVDSSTKDESQQKQHQEEQQPRQRLLESELKLALKKLKAEKVADTEPGVDGYKSYSELRKDFAAMQTNVKTDSELLQQLMTEWNATSSSERHLQLLQELEYLVHQIDNAENFVKLGGVQILTNLLNQSSISDQMLIASLKTLSASAQGNAKVQVAAVQNGLLQLLIRRLHHSPGSGTTAQVVLGIASMTRNFPFAQLLLVKSAGLPALLAAFQHEPLNAKTRVRIATLLADYVVESDATLNGIDEERRRQYAQAGIRLALSQSAWCRELPTLLQHATADHDVAEKTVIAMATLADACNAEFANWLVRLHSLANVYKELAATELRDEGQAGFFASLLDRILKLIKLIQPKDEF